MGNNTLKERHENSMTAAGQWLKSLDTAEIAPNNQALYTLAVKLCDREFLFHTVVEASGSPKINLSSPGALLSMRRPALLRLLLKAVAASKILWPEWPKEEVACLLGGIALSYARERDLIVVAALIRIAGRLSLRVSLLDEACEFLLDQQSDNGSFGLFASESLQVKAASALQLSRLRLTVDAVSALSSYLERSSPA